MFLKLYKISPYCLSVEPAKRRREWMNENPHVYKCGPVTNCNSFGWDIITIEDHIIEWNGGTSKEDLTVKEGRHTCHSNFGHGVLTFNVGYTWHTPKGWSLYVTDIPNEPTREFQTISALIETDVLKYPFFPSITFKQPGVYNIPRNTAICRVFPVLLPQVVECSPTIENEPLDFLDYRLWQTKQRNEFKQDSSQTGKKGWQRFYHNITTYPVIKMKEIKKQCFSL